MKEARKVARAALSGRKAARTDTERLDWLGRQDTFTWTEGPGDVRPAIDEAMKARPAFI